MNAATDLAHLTDPIVAIATAPGRGCSMTWARTVGTSRKRGARKY